MNTIAASLFLVAAATGGVAARNNGLKCIPEPYPDAVAFNRNLVGAVACLHYKLGDPGEDGTTGGLWYSSETNDRATMQENSAIGWGFTEEDPDPPAIISHPTTDEEIKRALSCSIRNRIRVVPWSKGHNWVGLTALPNYALIRLDRICDVTVDQESKSLTISAGCATGHQVGMLSLFGDETDKRMLLNFGCPNIGIGGSFLGGGQGYFSGYIGMQIDTAKKIYFLLYEKNGYVKEVVAERTGRYAELYWAALGGMSGYGIVTKIELKTVESPSPDAVTWIDLYYGGLSRGKAQYLFQELLLSNPRFGIAQSNRFDTTGSQVRVSYLGPAHEAIKNLKEAGMIDDNLLDTIGTYEMTPDHSRVSMNYEQKCTGMTCKDMYDLPARGVVVFEYPNFREFTAMAWFNPATVDISYACDPVANPYGLDCGPENGAGNPGQYSFISNRTNALKVLEMAEDSASDLLDPISPFWRKIPRSVFQSPGLQWRLSEEGWEELAKFRDNAAADNCAFTFLFTHATGGVAAQVPQSDTAYPWRGYPLLNFFLGDTGSEECKPYFQQILSDLREMYAVDGYSGGGAYINYPGNPNNCCNGDILPWEQLYYGGNYERLQRARTMYDPLQIYSKPQLPEPEKVCKRRERKAGYRGGRGYGSGHGSWLRR